MDRKFCFFLRLEIRTFPTEMGHLIECFENPAKKFANFEEKNNKFTRKINRDVDEKMQNFNLDFKIQNPKVRKNKILCQNKIQNSEMSRFMCMKNVMLEFSQKNHKCKFSCEFQNVLSRLDLHPNLEIVAKLCGKIKSENKISCVEKLAHRKEIDQSQVAKKFRTSTKNEEC